MLPFVACEIFKNDMFGITMNGEIWRVHMENAEPQVMRMLGEELEYTSIFNLLRAYRHLYR